MTKELKFDRARFDAGEMPTRTRNGRTVLRVVDSGLDVPYPLSTWLEGLRRPLSHTHSGRANGDHPDPLDLVHEPRKTKVTAGEPPCTFNCPPPPPCTGVK